LHVLTILVPVGVNGYRSDPQALEGAENAYRYLTAVCYQDFVEDSLSHGLPFRTPIVVEGLLTVGAMVRVRPVSTTRRHPIDDSHTGRIYVMFN
jgi:hypothetical protein